MSKIESYIHSHPKTAAALGLLAFVFFYLIFRKGGASQQSTGGNVAAATLQEQSLQAGASIQQAGIGAQVHAADLQAQLQNNSINAALSSENTKTEAGLIAALAANQTNARRDQLSAEVLSHQTSTEAAAYNHQIDAELAALKDTNATNLSATETQAGLLQYAYGQAATLARTQQSDQYNLNMATLSHVKDVNGSQNRTAIILGANGNIAGSTAAAYGQTVSSVSGDSFLSNLTKSVAAFASTVVKAI